MLRSKYAKAEDPTFVELTFAYSGKKYTVCRNPEYMRAKKNQPGITKQPAKAELLLPDGKLITRVTDVNRAIRENGKVLFSEEAVSLTCSLIKMEIGLPLTKEEKQKEKQFTEKK
jgi:hypothetical protein